ncbi:MAG: hypothetical protein HQL69_02205 [Magnetococcales bacterium]|nr:hypothetical protein [Magnetococcales bacterium]
MGQFLTLLFIFIISFPGEIIAAERKAVVEFSADVVRTIPGKKDKVSRGRMFVSRYGIRTEGKKNSKPVVFIFRPKKKIVWTLFPEEKLYEERLDFVVKRPPLPMDHDSPCKTDKGVVCQLLGSIVLNERNVEHWLISRRGPQKFTPIVQLWIDRKLNVALRETFLDGMTIELQNLQEKAQNIKLFVVPGEYKKKPLVKKAAKAIKK